MPKIAILKKITTQNNIFDSKTFFFLQQFSFKKSPIRKLE